MNPLAGFRYSTGFLTPGRADALLDLLWRELKWEQYRIRLFGRLIAQPRLSAWCCDPGVLYRYSGLELPQAAWHPELDGLRNELQRVLDTEFNSVLANAYRNGRDSMGWHADDERELGPEPLIASISLGATRRFLVREKSGGPSSGLNLEHGSLLVMSGRSQERTLHSIPKTRKEVTLRINLTFRLINRN